MVALADDDLEWKMLPRLGFWAVAAVVCVVLAVVSVRSEMGIRRLAELTTRPAPATPKISNQDVAALAQPREDLRRTLESVRSLSADQDQLLARIAVLERNLEDVTGSVGRIDAARETSSAPVAIAAPVGPTMSSTIAVLLASPPQTSAAPSAATPAREAAPQAPQPVQQAAAPEASATAVESISTQTEFGVDIGGAINLRSARELWLTTKNTHAAQLGGMTPVVTVRDAKNKSVQLGVIAGPLANASAAARLCATLSSNGLAACQPAAFDGQKLAIQ